MTTTGLNMQNANWLRQVRCWCGILLMAFSLLGGNRVATGVTEETSSEETSEVLEYAHRLSDCGQRSPGRRVPTLLDRPTAVPHVSRAATLRDRATRELGSVPASGHELSNGLCAPQRC